jgi:putative RecB family exonuclease
MAFTPPPHLSPSSIGTFKQCQLKFKFSKIDKISEDPTGATLMGNFVHEVLENFYVLPPDNRTIHEVKQISTSVWAESGWLERVEPIIANSKDVRSGKSTLALEMNAFKHKCWDCIANLWKIENPTTIQPAGIEHELNGKISGVTIKGFIDRFSWEETGYVISDYKTGKTPKANWVQDKFFQLVVYSHLLESTGVGKTQSVELLYLKDGVSFKREVTDKMLADVEKEVSMVKEQVDTSCEKEDFTTTKSILCDWCSFKKVCPAWS